MEAKTPYEFKKGMEAIAEIKDHEIAHMDADDLLCLTLKSLGYGEGVEIFYKMDKWYA